ncbi:MAG: biotin--[acetyl-CoA-carboxylase] ligase [Sinobacteraceae bacterium]|nr:biotin--[acetyl-CoA-carboxylase] ligase [Nevskiaceae bacterium]
MAHMSTLLEQVYRTLATGQTLSGEALAQGLGVTRSAVWKAIETLRDLGLSIEAQTQRGYRLTSPVQALDAAALRAALQPVAEQLHSLEVRWSAPSTNAELLAAAAPPVGQFDVLLVEHQSAGRGRRGRAWRSALGDSVCLSVATSFDPTPRDLPALTLVIGLSVRAALQRCGAKGIGLKWPNDLVLVQRDAEGQAVLAKLGGILVELRAEAAGPAHVVIGVGLNLRLDPAVRSDIATTGNLPAALAECGVDPLQRNALIACVLESMMQGVLRFAAQGFAPFRAVWAEADALRGEAVRVSGAGAERTGTAMGIDAQGALQLRTAQGEELGITAGEVSVRRSGS